MSTSPSTSRPGSTQSSDPKAPLSPEQLESARKMEILDKDGEKMTFGDVTLGKRISVVFIRHFWCGNCKAYISQLGSSIPPHKLPEGTSIIIIGCGTSQPIPAYLELTHSPYPIYACPSLELHRIFGFSHKMSGSKAGEEKEYEKELGGTITRIWSSIASGPMRHLEHVSAVGPKGQNGGELILEADGTCSYVHRMQHAADHTELADLARVMGAEYVPQPSRRASEAKEGRKSTSSGVEKADRELEQAQVSAK